MTPDWKNLAILKRSRWPVCKVADRNQRTDLTVYDVRFGRGRQKLIHRAAFVGFHMGKSDPTQVFQWDHGPNGRRYFGEHVTKARMKEERFVTVYQELIKRESGPMGTNVEIR